MLRVCCSIAVLLPAAAFASGEARAVSDPAADLERFVSTAESHLQAGDLEAAEGRYRDALFNAWLLMARLERLERHLPEAGEALRNACAFAGQDRDALHAVALAHLNAGESARALEILTELVGPRHRDPQTRRTLARALAAAGDLDRAVRTLEEARAIAPDDPELAFAVATDLLWLHRVDAAEPLFAQLRTLRPMAETRVLIGRAYRDAAELERARAELEAALQLDPAVRRAHYYLGTVILAETGTGPGRIERAIAEFLEERKLAPEDHLLCNELGLALLEAGRHAEALQAFETAARAEPRALYLHHVARCQLALERPADAAASSRRALELAEEQGVSDAELEKIHYQLGLVLRKLGAAQEAAAHLAEAKRLAARWTETPRDREGPRVDDSAASGQRAVAPLMETFAPSAFPATRRPEIRRRVTWVMARAYLNLGVIRVQRHDFVRAADLFEQAVAADPDFPRVQYSLGVARFNAKQFDKATDPLSRALAAQPDDAGIKRMLALAWLNTAAYEKAAALLKDDPERGTDPSLQFAYGLALARSGRTADAEAVLEDLRARHGESAELRDVLRQIRGGP